jgi:hypothetical protein
VVILIEIEMRPNMHLCKTPCSLKQAMLASIPLVQRCLPLVLELPMICFYRYSYITPIQPYDWFFFKMAQDEKPAVAAKNGPATAAKPEQAVASIWTRKLDMLYLAFFAVHIVVMLRTCYRFLMSRM